MAFLMFGGGHIPAGFSRGCHTLQEGRLDAGGLALHGGVQWVAVHGGLDAVGWP